MINYRKIKNIKTNIVSEIKNKNFPNDTPEWKEGYMDGLENVYKINPYTDATKRKNYIDGLDTAIKNINSEKEDIVFDCD